MHVQIVMMLFLWWAPWTRLWSFEGFATTPSTLRHQYLVPIAVSLRGEKAFGVQD